MGKRKDPLRNIPRAPRLPRTPDITYNAGPFGAMILLGWWTIWFMVVSMYAVVYLVWGIIALCAVIGYAAVTLHDWIKRNGKNATGQSDTDEEMPEDERDSVT